MKNRVNILDEEDIVRNADEYFVKVSKRMEQQGHGIINNTNGKIASLCLGQTKTACYPQLVETSFYLCPNPTQTCLCDA